MRFSKVILLSAVAAVLPLASQANSIGSDPTLSISGLTFNDFSCSLSNQGSASPLGCGKINVNTITEPGTGIQFSSGFTASSFGFVSYDDAVINYHVTSGTAISNVGLDFNGTFYGYAISSVTETIFDAAGQQVGFASVACGVHAGCTRTDDIMLSGSYTDLYVTKDINVSSFVGGGLSQISYIDQTFDAAAPEPASFAMLGTGLLGAAGLLRRRAKAAAKKAVTA